MTPKNIEPDARLASSQKEKVINMEWVEVRAENIEAAEELALDQLGVAREDAEFEVVTRKKIDFLDLKKQGLGTCKAG